MLTGSIIKNSSGFTLIEMLIVLAVLALLSSLAVPSITSSLQHSKESALKHDLVVMRKAIDDYYADNREHPPGLEALVAEKYLKYIPKDPFTGDNRSWVAVFEGEKGGLSDVRSGYDGVSRDGEKYQEW